MLAARAVGAALALVVCAWCALGIVQASATDAARERAVHQRVYTRADITELDRLLDRAGTLNPDRQVDVLRADALFARRDVAGARRLLVGVVGSEPDNLLGWQTIAIAFARIDPVLARRARANLRRLSPPVREP